MCALPPIQLNDSQRRAVESKAQYLQIIGYPGSGKTLVLVSRIAQLIHKGVPPESIVALTFTNSACYSLRAYIRAALNSFPDRANAVNILTYHSYCRSLVDAYAQDVGLTSEWAMLDFLDLHNLLFHPTLKLRRKRSSGYPFTFNEHEISVSKKLFQKYKAYDFDSALEYGRSIVTNRDVGVSHLFLDEFQDCTNLQWGIAKAILQKNPRASIVAAGDPNQEIFKFQKDHFDKAFSRMQHEFPQTEVLHLTNNYRSTAPIIEAFQSVLDDSSPFKPPLKSMHPSGDEPVMIVCENAVQEKREVISLIKHLHEDKGYKFSDIAILVRSNANVTEFLNVLEKENLPNYSLTSMHSIGVKKLPSVALTLLKWAHRSRDMFLIQLLHNRLHRFVSDTDMEKLYSSGTSSMLFSTTSSSPPVSLTDQLIALNPKKYKHRFLLEWLPSLRHRLLDCREPADVLETTKYAIGSWKKNAGSCGNVLGQDTQDWITFVRVFEKCCSDFNLLNLTLEEQAQQGAVLSGVLKALFDPNLSNASKNNEIAVTTIHSAKSQEWPVVILPTGVLNGFAMSESYEESRKLQYVAASRAMKNLYFTTSGKIDYNPRHSLVQIREDWTEKFPLVSAAQALERDSLVFKPINAVRILKRFIRV